MGRGKGEEQPKLDMVFTSRQLAYKNYKRQGKRQIKGEST